MIKILCGRGGEYVKWADKKILSDDHFPEDSVFIALLDGQEIRGVTVFTDYRGDSISLHGAGAFTGWMTPHYVRFVYDYVFNQLKCKRVGVLVRTDNIKAIVADLKMGYKFEGCLRRADCDGSDLYILGMTKEECRWIKKDTTGKEA